MHSFKILLIFSAILLIGCNDSGSNFFHEFKQSESDSKIGYDDIHQLNLQMSKPTKTIDESGFSPILTTSFSLTNHKNKIWPQAWIAFQINFYIEDQQLSNITESGSLHQHSLEITIDQALPKFGLNESDIHIIVTPISWMPTYPLNIEPAQNTKK